MARRVFFWAALSLFSAAIFPARRTAPAGLLQQEAASPVLKRQFRQWLIQKLNRPPTGASTGAAAQAASRAAKAAARRRGAGQAARRGARAAAPWPAATVEQQRRPLASARFVGASELGSPSPYLLAAQEHGRFDDELDDYESDVWRFLQLDRSLQEVQKPGGKAFDYIWEAYRARNDARNVIDTHFESMIPSHIREWAEKEVADISAACARTLERPTPTLAAGGSDPAAAAEAVLPGLQADVVQECARECVAQSDELVARLGVVRDIDLIRRHLAEHISDAVLDDLTWNALYERAVWGERGSSSWDHASATIGDLASAAETGPELDEGTWSARLLDVLREDV